MSLQEREQLFSNPSYHQIRGGYPAPTSAWYRNEVSGIHAAMKPTPENFIVGFNLTLAQFLILRDFLVSLIHSTRAQKNCGVVSDNERGVQFPLWKIKAQGDDTKSYWHTYETTIYNDYVWPIYLQLQEHAYLSSVWRDGRIDFNDQTTVNVPFQWRHHMTMHIVTTTIDFIIRTAKNTDPRLDFPSWPAFPEVSFKWGDMSLSPTKKPRLPKLKAISIRIVDTLHPPKVTILNLHELVPSADLPISQSAEDISLNAISFNILEEILRSDSNIAYEATSAIQFKSPRAGFRATIIINDVQLQYAVKALREYGSTTINLQVVARALV